MRIFSFFLVFFIIVFGVNGENKKKKVSKNSNHIWTKEEIQLFYKSWIIEDLQFPEIPKPEEIVSKPVEVQKQESPPPVSKIIIQENTKKNSIFHFFSENIKLILIGIAILTFALYRLRYGTSTPSSSGRIFSKFKNK